MTQPQEQGDCLKVVGYASTLSLLLSIVRILGSPLTLASRDATHHVARPYSIALHMDRMTGAGTRACAHDTDVHPAKDTGGTIFDGIRTWRWNDFSHWPGDRQEPCAAW